MDIKKIKSEFSIISLLKNKLSMSNIEINTRSVLLNDFISFVRLTSNKPELFLLEKIVKQGNIVLNLSLNLDEDGKVKNDYKINGLVENGNIDFLNQDKLEKINLSKDFIILIINTFASFCLGLFLSLEEQLRALTFYYHLVLFFSIGFLGSLSTFSSFVYDLFDLFLQLKFFRALRLFIMSASIGIIAFSFGLFLGNQ